MPIDPTIRRLVRDPDIILGVRMIDHFFKAIAELKEMAPVAAEATAEETIETGWRMMKRGILRLYDPEIDDDDDPFIQGAITPGQRARARTMGAKLFAVRQHIRRFQNAKMDYLPMQRTKAVHGRTPH